MNDFATTLIIETPRKTTTVLLKRALTLTEIYDLLWQLTSRRAVCSLSKGVARATF